MSEDNNTRPPLLENINKTREKSKRKVFKAATVTSPKENTENVEIMSKLDSTRRSIQENINKMEKNWERRRSLFENPNEMALPSGTEKVEDLSRLDRTLNAINDTIADMETKSERRRSVFVNANVTSSDKLALKKWDERWGKFNLDYVNVVKYPEEYVHKIIEEREGWLKGMKDTNKKLDELKLGGMYHVTEEILTSEHKDSLSVIDSSINEFIKNSTTFLKEFEVYKRMQSVQLEKIERERELIEKMSIK